jgi:uncharacterized membrane protein (DUF4010 family)
MVLISIGILRAVRKHQDEMPKPSNPSELESAITFAALYALVILVTAAVKDYFGSRALYSVAFVSGFVDVDAITLSTTQLANQDRLSTQTAWRVILIATVTNIAFKTGIATLLGSRHLLRNWRYLWEWTSLEVSHSSYFGCKRPRPDPLIIITKPNLA